MNYINQENIIILINYKLLILLYFLSSFNLFIVLIETL